MKVRKAVITAAGWGTRLLPATKAQPKEMLPLLNKPVIQYAVEEAVASGIEQIIIVTAPGKHAVEAHFGRSLELEYLLRQKGLHAELAKVCATNGHARLCYVHQAEQLGLGHAVLTAREIVDGESFALILPDDVIRSNTPATRQLLNVFEERQSCVVAVEEVPEDRTSSYGVITPAPLRDSLYQVLSLVEKPELGCAPSNLAVVGRYVLTPDIFTALEHTPPGRGGEIQLTDGLNSMLTEHSIVGYRFEGRRYDTGTPLGLLKASIAVACEDPSLARELEQYVAGLTASAGHAVL
ncbi:MAG: UTP--glucose-1-phosphate uridylyltransferase GalU [Chloroflexi bacterium]|nr:UTP--glucose-1-phosphate uridylyltransferase GalU [Chloroflexota bacterium]